MDALERENDRKQLLKTVQKELADVLGFDDGGHLATFVVGLDTEADMRSHLDNLLGRELASSPRVNTLIASVLERHRRWSDPASAASKRAGGNGDFLEPAGPKTKGPSAREQKGRGLRIVYKQKKKGHGQGAEAVRRECGCQALRHEAFINCTACGRILCDREGEGPCFFCGSFVTLNGTVPSDEFVQVMRQGTAQLLGPEVFDGVFDPLSAASGEASEAEPGSAAPAKQQRLEAGLQAALAQRDAILNYVAQQEKAGKAGRRLIDDQEDFYAFDAFDSPEERRRKEEQQREHQEKLQELARRRRLRVNIDLETGVSSFVAADAELGESMAFTKKPEREPDEAAAAKGAASASAVAAHEDMLAQDDDLGACYFSNKANLYGRALEVYESLRKSVAGVQLQSSQPQPPQGDQAQPAQKQAARAAGGEDEDPVVGQQRAPPAAKVRRVELEGELEALVEEEQRMVPARRQEWVGVVGGNDFERADAQLARLTALRQRKQRRAALAKQRADDPDDLEARAEEAALVSAADPAGQQAAEDAEAAAIPENPLWRLVLPRELANQDQGVCLSMHQPWASLLVHGIKIFEGRDWPTDYRGRLWIASAVKEMEPGVREALEEEYRQVYAPRQVIFPSSYPTGVLLGCVDLVDCLPNAEFRALGTSHVSEAEYLFVCRNPRQLLVKVPAKGGHKLWHLGGASVKLARSSLRPPQPPRL